MTQMTDSITCNQPNASRRMEKSEKIKIKEQSSKKKDLTELLRTITIDLNRIIRYMHIWLGLIEYISIIES